MQVIRPFAANSFFPARKRMMILRRRMMMRKRRMMVMSFLLLPGMMRVLMRRRFMGVRMGGMCQMMASVRIVRVELREMFTGAG